MKYAYLIFSNPNLIAGGHRVVFEHANHLAMRGHDVSIWSATYSKDKPPFVCTVPIYSMGEQNAGSFDAVIFTDTYFIPKVFNMFSAKKYFLLVQHDLELLHQLNNQHDLLEKDLVLFNNFPSFCGVLSTSTWIKNILYEKYKLNSILVPCGINPDLFYPAEPALKHSDPSVLLYYDPQIWKGFKDALVATALLKQKINKCQTLIFGATWPDVPTELSPSMGVKFAWPMIYFCNPRQEDLAHIYSSADVFVSSSWYEGFGLPGLEAMACGVPVVATDSGGVREYAVHEENCLMVPAKNPTLLADAIIRVLKDKHLRKTMITNGLKRAREFEWDKIIDTLESALRS